MPATAGLGRRSTSTVRPDHAERASLAAATLAVDAVTAEVVRAFEAAGVPSVLLKGPAVAAWLYGPSEVRSYTDVDLLVPVDRRSAAEGVLRRLGFRYLLDAVLPLEEVEHARTWVRGPDPAVDLHTTLPLLPDGARAWAVLGDGPDTLSVGGATVAVPRPACLALIVAFHALQHGPDDQQHVDELGRALTVADLDLWRGAAGVADQLRAGGFLRAALSLVPIGLVLADKLGLPPVPVRAAILASTSFDARACALALDRIGASPSLREKASLLSRLLVPTPGYLRATRADGDSGVVASYRRRLARLAGAPRGYLIWRKAVRDCGEARRLTDRVEVVGWALAARALVAVVGATRALGVLDRVSVRRRGGEHLAATDRDALFRLAGRCLGEAVARSEYLRVRGCPHELVLGVAKSGAEFHAHAWLEPLDPMPAGFVVLHPYSREPWPD